MIPADLLSALREKDPELWERATRTELATIEYCDTDGDECEPDYIYWAGLRSEAQDAWLQHCLQEAIRWRGYSHELKYLATSQTAIADIYFENSTWSAEGSTEAEALMRAYLSALSGERI